MKTMFDGLCFIRRLKNALQDEPEKFREISRVLEEFESQKISPRTVSQRAKEILENHPQLIQGLNEFLPEEFKISTLLEDREKHGDGKANQREAMDFIRKVKERCVPSTFEDFLSILRKFKEQELSRRELCAQLFTLLSGDPELIEGFSSLTGEKPSFLHEEDENLDTDEERREENSSFSQNNCKMDDATTEENSFSSRNNDGMDDDMDLDTAEGRFSFELQLKKGCIPFNQIKKKLSLDNYEVFLKIVHSYNIGEISIRNLTHLVIELMMKQCSEDEEEVKYTKQVSKSYWLRPKGFELPTASATLKQHIQVLNNDYACTSRKTEYAFKPEQFTSMNKYQNEVEDDKFELDMVKELVKSAADRVKSLWDGTFVADSARPKETLTAINLRCIEMLYGDRGLEIIEELEKNPSAVLPIIYKRLKQKQEELEQQSSIYDKKWAKYLAEKCRQTTSRRKRIIW